MLDSKNEKLLFIPILLSLVLKQLLLLFKLFPKISLSMFILNKFLLLVIRDFTDALRFLSDKFF